MRDQGLGNRVGKCEKKGFSPSHVSETGRYARRREFRFFHRYANGGAPDSIWAAVHVLKLAHKGGKGQKGSLEFRLPVSVEV